MALITDAASLQNEFKAWPPLVRIGSGFDLVTANHWFDAVGTPTTQATAVPASGEASLDAKFLQVIKCVTDAANEGWSQRYTYADEPRIKSGKKISGQIWLGTTSGGSSGLTVKLVNSDASNTTGTVVATDGDFSLYKIPDHTCAGTYVELVVTKDASGTFYAGGNITVMVGRNVVELAPRGLTYRHVTPVEVVSLDGAGDPNTWTDIDLTSSASPLAAIAQIHTQILGVSGSSWALGIRRNGSSDALGAINQFMGTSSNVEIRPTMTGEVILDDVQIFEYILDRFSGSGSIGDGAISLWGYWEWE